MDFTRRKIKNPRSLGEILKVARKKKELTLEQAEEETKVRARYLEALENDAYENLPASVYAAGFLAKYADFLSLDKEKMIKQFNDERGLSRSNSKIMVERRLKEPFFQITPRFLTIAAVVVAMLSIFSYIGYSVHNLSSPPNLEISSPLSDQVLTTDTVEIIGKTDEGVTLTINSQTVFLDDKGNFHQAVNLTPGLNSFEIRAINQLKKENVKIVKVLAEIGGSEETNGTIQ